MVFSGDVPLQTDSRSLATGFIRPYPIDGVINASIFRIRILVFFFFRTAAHVLASTVCLPFFPLMPDYSFFPPKLGIFSYLYSQFPSHQSGVFRCYTLYCCVAIFCETLLTINPLFVTSVFPVFYFLDPLWLRP